jgi:hypothetical protein
MVSRQEEYIGKKKLRANDDALVYKLTIYYDHHLYIVIECPLPLKGIGVHHPALRHHRAACPL